MQVGEPYQIEPNDFLNRNIIWNSHQYVIQVDEPNPHSQDQSLVIQFNIAQFPSLNSYRWECTIGPKLSFSASLSHELKSRDL